MRLASAETHASLDLLFSAWGQAWDGTRGDHSCLEDMVVG